MVPQILGFYAGAEAYLVEERQDLHVLDAEGVASLGLLDEEALHFLRAAADAPHRAFRCQKNSDRASPKNENLPGHSAMQNETRTDRPATGQEPGEPEGGTGLTPHPS